MKVGYSLEQEEFEYDIRGLLMACYPGAEIIQDPQEPVDVMLQVPASDLAARVDRKTALKAWAYRELSARTGRQLPWGTLTGIRPTKIAMALLEEGCSGAEIAERMQKDHLVSREKAELSARIAATERQVLSHIDYENGYSLYVGIPFCPTTCLYCSFTSYPMSSWEPRMGDSLDALDREIDYTAERFRDK